MPDQSPALAFERVTKAYGATIAVDAVSLDIAGGSFVALVGTSGSGKSTLLKTINRLVEPSDGRVLLDGTDVTHGPAPALRRLVGYVFQNIGLFPHMTIAENVGYGLRVSGVPRKERQARVDEVLRRMRLPDVGKRKPAQLSGGQRQRVALARAIVKRPRLLLLDEPLSALDRKVRGDMQLELKRLQHEVGITFVVVTHDQEEAMSMAVRIAVMADGRHSITHYETLEAHRFASLLEVHLETGRTHQIRVHMSALKHPCVGDLTYGADPTLASRLGLERQWLHAMRLGFEHPETGDQVSYESTYPDDLAHALDVIRDEH